MKNEDNVARERAQNLWKFRCASTVNNQKCLVKLYERLTASGQIELVLERFSVKTAKPTTRIITNDDLKSLGINNDFKSSSYRELKHISSLLDERLPDFSSLEISGLKREILYVGGHKLQGRLILTAANTIASYEGRRSSEQAKPQVELCVLQPATGAVHAKMLFKEDLEKLKLGNSPSQEDLKGLFNQVQLPSKSMDPPSLAIGNFEKHHQDNSQAANWPTWCKGKTILYGGVFQMDGVSVPLSVYLKGTQLAIVGLEPATLYPLRLELDLKSPSLASLGRQDLQASLLDPTVDRKDRKKVAKELCKLVSLHKAQGTPPELVLPKVTAPRSAPPQHRLSLKQSIELFTPRSSPEENATSTPPAEDEVSVAHTLGTLPCGSTVCTLGRALKKKAMKISGQFTVARVYEADGLMKVRAYFPRSDKMLECTAAVERGLEPLEDFCDQVLKSLVLDKPGNLVSLRELFDDVDANYTPQESSSSSGSRRSSVHRRASTGAKILPRLPEEHAVEGPLEYLTQVKARVRELYDLAKAQVEEAVRSAEVGLEYARWHQSRTCQTSPRLSLGLTGGPADLPPAAQMSMVELSRVGRPSSAPTARALEMREHGPLPRVESRQVSDPFIGECLDIAMERAVDSLVTKAHAQAQARFYAHQYLQHQGLRARALDGLQQIAKQAEAIASARDRAQLFLRSEAEKAQELIAAELYLPEADFDSQESSKLAGLKIEVDSLTQQTSICSDYSLTREAEKHLADLKSSRMENSSTTNRVLDTQYTQPESDEDEVTKFPWEHPTNQEFHLVELDSPMAVLGAGNNGPTSLLGDQPNQMPSLDDVLSLPPGDKGFQASPPSPQSSPGGRVSQLRRWSQKRRELQASKHREQLASTNPLNHSLYSSHTMQQQPALHQDARPTTAQEEHDLRVSESEAKLERQAVNRSRSGFPGSLSKASSTSALLSQQPRSSMSSSFRDSSRRSTKRAVGDVLEDVKRSTQGGNSGEGLANRHSSLDAYKRMGYGTGKSKYVSYWRKRLSKSRHYYQDQFHLLKCVSELRKAFKTCTNEEAFCALAQCRGQVGDAYSQLCQPDFNDEVNLICKILDVKEYMNISDASAEATLNSNSAKELPEVVLPPGSSRRGSRQVLEGLVGPHKQTTQKATFKDPFPKKKDYLDGLPDMMKKHHMRAAQLKSVERLSTPTYRSNQKYHRGAMVRDELDSVDLATQSIQLVDEIAEIHRHQSLQHIL
mmetsp:Transcript_10645/g.13820  ORF Transcript_10645/g.13820 Transcript_10645/m.13820 type:complete len:1229 (-) Transcript_10645:405-4091(-)